MILASLRTNGRCVEMMEFNGYINGGIYFLLCLMRFRHLSHMLSHYAQLSSCMHARLSGSMHAYLVELEALDLISVRASLSTCTAVLVGVHTDTTMDPRCVRAANILCETAQIRLSCRCSHNRLVCFIGACISNSFGYRRRL